MTAALRDRCRLRIRVWSSSGGALPGEFWHTAGNSMATSDFKSLYLFADSQLLFWNQRGRQKHKKNNEQAAAKAPQTTKKGTTNADRPEFYEIFTAAMQSV